MASSIWVRLCLVLSSDFDCKKNDRTIWFPDFICTSKTCHQWLWCSWNRGHCLWGPAWPRNKIVPSLSLQWKSDESTKHYTTQMLLAINWYYWQAWRNSHMRMRVQGRLMQVHLIEIHLVFAKKNKDGYFSNRAVFYSHLLTTVYRFSKLSKE